MVSTIENLQILTPTKEYNQDLIELSYKSLFYKRKEFEYIRLPPDWFRRYELSTDSIKKIAVIDGKVIASIGLLIRNGVVNGKKVIIGCLVDNCLNPDYAGSYELIFDKLLTVIEREALNKNVDVIEGWDFAKNIIKHNLFFQKKGYTYVNGVNWFPGGSNPFGIYPSLIWKILLKIYYLYFKFFSILLKPISQDLRLEAMSRKDYSEVGDFLSKSSEYYEFGSIYKNNEFEKIAETNNIHGVIARKENKIVGVLTYIISAWSGWMFGKPLYEKNFTPFLSYTPDEFHVSPEYHETSLGSRMLLEVMETKNPHLNEKINGDYLFNVDVFHNKIFWRKRALIHLGYSEPAFDYGVILAKSLNKSITLDTSKNWLLPARYILSPVLKKEFIPHSKLN